ncbi:MAG TPA: hypothetical protein VLV15_15840 [Dongiaceae bacterium]|nr:hypothetical protein [Dongiaceae bacterium]
MLTRMSWRDLLVLPALLGAAALLWLLHARAWDLGGRSPVLGYDTAQYALAARELSFHGQFATPFALPIELVHQADPPWPLAVVQPGLVVFEAFVFKLVPPRGVMATSDARAWLTLVLPFMAFLLVAGSLGIAVRHLFRGHHPTATAFERNGAALALGLMFVLDPEAQHFAIGGFTEIPFTAGLLFATLGLALGRAAAAPLAFGLVLGLCGLFRANMLWLGPLFILGAALLAAPGRRLRALVQVVIGFVLPLAPWWLYKWREFGDPGWDLSRYAVWDRVGGRDWFSLYHLPEIPTVPQGAEAARLLAAKVAHNLPGLVLDMSRGLRALWAGAIVLWLLVVRPPRALAIAALVMLGAAVFTLFTTALSIPWLRYLFPVRVLLECTGMLALWALIAGLPGLTAGQRRGLQVAVAALALVWGVWQTMGGLAEARATSAERGVPASGTFTELSILINRELKPGEVVMSNLGPALAWQTLHPVIHLALSPADVESCRRRRDFRVVLLAFREPDRAWPGWVEIMSRYGAAATEPGLGVLSERRYRSSDGFTIVWLTLGPLAPGVADAPPGGGIELAAR